MDISRFDFDLDEIVDLLPRLTGLAKLIELEPRIHDSEESEDVHVLRTEPTFRISCQLSGSDQAVRHMADLETETGVEVVLDHDRIVRLRHLPKVETSSGSSHE